MSAGEIAGLIAAVAFVALVGALVVPLLKLGRTVDELTATVRDVRQQHVAKSSVTVDEVNVTLATVNQSLQRVDAIADSAQTAAGNAAALSNTVAATFGGPLIRVSSFSYGVRQAIATRRPERSARPRRGAA